MSSPPQWVMQAFSRLPGPLQTRVQALIVKVMKDQYWPALATLPAAWMLIYVPHFVKMALLSTKPKLEFNISNPRYEDPKSYDRYSELFKRATGCHQNGFESFAPFAAAVLLCKVQKAKPFEVARLCYRYLVLRLVYTLVYLAGRSEAVACTRPPIWAASKFTVWQLFMKAL
mmetsp:Transcript_71011/g.123167  ORF Transcript_71011/g.123167 Transcript_71011/m.123167 type:complete len:172 (+) Transcript_71011:48-563(+)